MGYIGRNTRRPWLLLDFETTACREIDQFEEDVRIDSRLKDPDKIAEARRAALEKVATDIDLARIVCTGLWASSDDGPTVLVHTELDVSASTEEAHQLETFWSAYRDVVMGRGGVLVGFNILSFDLPLAVRRSQYLGVPYEMPNLYRFKSHPVIDLANELSFFGAKPMRSQSFYCRRFGIDVPDDTTGADMPALIAAGDWSAVRAHNLADLRRTHALAQRLGYIGAALAQEAVA